MKNTRNYTKLHKKAQETKKHEKYTKLYKITPNYIKLN